MEENARLSIQALLSSRREQAEETAKRRKAELEERVSGFAELDREISSCIPRLMKLAAEGGDDYEEKSDALYREHEDMIIKKKALLKGAGYPEDYDLPPYTCPLCRDTGYVEGRVCRCVKEARTRYAYTHSGLGRALAGQTFDTLDMRYYSGTTSNGYSVKNIMESLVEYCRDYARRFKPGAENLLFIGGAGLGKTHIASAIGREVIDKGFSVVYESAQKIAEAFEAEHFGRVSGGETGRFMECDLLIIDDLGSEYVTAFTVAAFFGLLNHRIINGLSTLVTTNLGFSDIESVYKERIFSRLRGEYKALIFCGCDIRRIKKESE